MASATLKCGQNIFSKKKKTLIMGILNVTPDSFSDGAQFQSLKQAIDYAKEMIQSGADIIDVGGESTAPKRQPVSASEEISRVKPVVEALVSEGINQISVDTTKYDVAQMAIDSGASWVNDQSAGLKDPQMYKAMLNADAVVLMHNHFGPSGVHAGENETYQDVCADVIRFFSKRLIALKDQGVGKEKIIIDPGVGFGKGLDDSLALLNQMYRFEHLGFMTMVGLSRKSFIGELSGISDPKARDFATLGANAAAIFSGADIIRTHNVKAARDALLVLDRCLARTGARSSDENLYQARR